MIDKILILACDRHTYLAQTLGSVKNIDVEKIIILDKPKVFERVNGWKECKKLIIDSGVPFVFNEENKGCTPSMFDLLGHRAAGINLILEDDCPLVEGAIEKIEEVLKQIDHKRPFIIKLNRYFWGWIANDRALDIFYEFRTQNTSKEDLKNDVVYRAIKIFQEQNHAFVWDELMEVCINYCGIEVIRLGEDLTDNIGRDSTRKENTKTDVKHTAFALFKNGEIESTGTITKKDG